MTTFLFEATAARSYITPAAVSDPVVWGCAVSSTGNEAHRNSKSHWGVITNLSTVAGTTMASPRLKVTGAARSAWITPQPPTATRHQTLRGTCFGRRNSQAFDNLNLSTIKHGDVIK